MPRPSPVVSDRYAMDEIRERIERMRTAVGVTDPKIYRAIKMGQTAWNRKMAAGKPSTFSVVELAAIADYFSHKVGKPLTGWPFVDAEAAALLDELRTRRG